MASVTQTVPNFLGGVSKQTDQKKLAGQVRDCLNALPDPTFGLQKRPGFKYIKTLHTSSDASSPDFANAKWFFIKRDNEEQYIGCILDSDVESTNPIKIWNKEGTACTVTYESGSKSYINTTRDNYHVLTVQDTSIVVNKTKVISATTAPTTYESKAFGTVRLLTVGYSVKYTVTLTVDSTDYSVNFTTLNAEDLSAADSSTNPSEEKYNTADRILTSLKSSLDALSITNCTLSVTKLDASLELALTVTSGGAQKPFELTVSDNQANKFITAYGEQVANISELPAESTHGRLAKVSNLGGAEAVFWSKFVADDGVKGKGVWEETINPEVSTGMDATSLPHELFNSATNTFVFRQPQDSTGTLAWKNRAVGDDVTNSHPSFVTKTIQQAFYHNNRLGFLTQDNVVMSKSDDFFNFYHTSALTQTDDDPIDINCSSIRPAVLHAVTPTAQGLILFSKNQQFIMFSDAEILTPSSAVIRGISNYEMDATVAPVEVGTTINFVSKTPSYTRVFGMQTRGSEESPIIVDIGKIVSEWIPDTITSLTSSPQNSLIAMYGTLDDTMYLYKTYAIGNQVLMQSWFNWDLPGNIQHASIDSDTMWSIVEKNGEYHMVSAILTQTPEETIMTTADGQQVNPHMDMYTAATNGLAGGSEKKVVYDSAGNFSKCYIPYADLTNLTPVILIAGNATQDFSGVTEYGFTVNPTRATDSDGTYFKVEGKDLSSQAANVYVGYQYNYDVELPKTYFKLDPEGRQYDYTASLTIARMKFAIGLSSVVGFKVKSKGYRGELKEYVGGGDSDTDVGAAGPPDTRPGKSVFTVPFPLKTENGILVKVDGAEQEINTAYTVTTTDAQATVTFLSGHVPLKESTTANVTTPAQKIEITTDTWYDVQPVQEANQYLADDVPLAEQAVFTVPIHQRTDNFNMRVFSNSPFPLSLTAMMWEGRYSPRFYRRT